MRDWNVVITVRDGGFTPALRVVAAYGPVHKTDFFNTLLLRAANPERALADLHERIREEPEINEWVSRFLPVHRLVNFQTVEEFEARCREAVEEWLPRLAHARFHVRMHRRGFKGKISSMAEERFLDTYLLDRLEERGTPAAIDFADPDVTVAIESIGPQAGISLFTRDDRLRFPLLHLD